MSDGVRLDNLQKVCLRQEGQYQRCMHAGRKGRLATRTVSAPLYEHAFVRLPSLRGCLADTE